MTTQRPQAASAVRHARQTRSPHAGSRRPAVGGESKSPRMGAPLDPAVAAYIGAIPPEHRALFDRIHRLILDTCPDATVMLSYNMPTYQLGPRRLHLGVWKHGVSLYGWKAHGDGGFTARHPDLQASTGTIRLHSGTAAAIADHEIRDLARAAFSPRPVSQS
jgi:uncharacterized protein YdhG (YjbR/CyaY superfamily)